MKFRAKIGRFYLFFMALMASLVLLGTLSTPASANPKYASIVMDADTGLILYQRYADKKLHPASLTKVMTLLLLFEAIDQGKIDINERIPISRHAANMVPSKLGLKPGSSIRVKDAIYALVTKSANDVAVAIAEKLGGSEQNFARMMTRKALSIGMNRTIFRNASGLHDKRQVSTARDMAKMASYVIHEYPEYYRYFSKRSFTYAGKTYRNHNRLLGKYEGMDGMKTGYINASGFNLVASAVQNNRRVIGVVFGGRTSNSRNAHMAAILDRGFAKLNEVRIASAKIPLPPRKPEILIALANLQKSPAVTNNPLVKKTAQEWSMVNPALENGMFGEIIGQGDYDPSVSKRIETGLIAIAAHKGESIASALASQKPAPVASTKPSVTTAENWAIQVGAFRTRTHTNRVLENVLTQLPSQYAASVPAISPIRTSKGTIYRARLAGMSETEALAACQHYLKDCITIAP